MMSQKEAIEAILEQLKKDLTRPRQVTEPISVDITNRYDVPGDAIGTFFTERLQQLEDYEVDITLSSLFTPTQEDRIPYMTLLGAGVLSTEDVKALIRQLEESQPEGQYLTLQGETVLAPVHPVNIERFVLRLHLDWPIDNEVYQILNAMVPAKGQAYVNLLARDEVWRGERRKELLLAFLKVFQERGTFSVPKMAYLTDFIRTYRPSCLFDLERQFEQMIGSCESDLENISGRGFHSEQLKEAYEESELAHLTDATVINRYTDLKEKAEALLEDYHQMSVLLPEYVAKVKAEQQRV